jgi:hypothetical protein
LDGVCGRQPRGGLFRADEVIERRVPFAALHESVVGTFETSRDVGSAVAIGGKADIAQRLQAPLDYDAKHLGGR